MSVKPLFGIFSGHPNIRCLNASKIGPPDQRFRDGYGKFRTFWPSNGFNRFWHLHSHHPPFDLCLQPIDMKFGLEGHNSARKKEIYSMPQTVWNTENVSKWTSNVQLLCSNASTYWIIYSWLTSNPKISIWVHTRAKIHSFSKCQNSDHF